MWRRTGPGVGGVGGSRGGGGGRSVGGRGGKRAEVFPDCFYTELISYSLSSPSLIRAPAAKRWSDFTSFSLGRPEETRCHCLLIFSRGLAGLLTFAPQLWLVQHAVCWLSAIRETRSEQGPSAAPATFLPLLKGMPGILKGTMDTMHLKGNTIHNVQLGKHAVSKDPAPRRRHFCRS